MRVVLVILLLCVTLAIAAKFWPASTSSPPPPAWSELDKALLIAIRDGDHAKVQSLLDQAADANALDESGETALMQAALNSDVRMMRLLLERGAAANARRRDGVHVLLRAVHDPDKVRLLLNNGTQVQPGAVVLAAMVPGSRKTLELLLAHGGDANADAGGFNALMAAALSGDLDSVTCLFEHGANLNTRTKLGYSALNAAAFSGNAAIVKLLLDRGADPNERYEVPDSNGDFRTPAVTAALQGHADCLKLLLDHGADINIQGGPFDRTALLGAATTGSEETVRLLLAKGADVHAQDWEGDTPLDWAALRGETAIVKLLRQAGGKARSQAGIRKPAAVKPALVVPSERRPIGSGGGSLPIGRGSDGARDAIRSAVAASLPPLQRTGQKITEENKCVTCHQHSLVAMTAGLARKHGLPVDEALAAKTQAQVTAVLGEKIPWLLLGADMDATLAPYTLVGMAAEDQKASPLTDALVHFLALRQRNDGRWLTEVNRPPEDASDFMFTALAIRGLQDYAPKGRSKEIAGRVARARSWLLNAKPAETVDSVFQLLGLRWANADTEPIQRLASNLLSQQREDGSWAQLPTLPSDAYATGQVLYALHQAAGLAVDSPAYRRGADFLLRTQLADGSWFVPTRCFPILEFSSSGFPHGRSQFISAAATCWATMALIFAYPPAST
jgi:ankyrin repeat protein